MGPLDECLPIRSMAFIEWAFFALDYLIKICFSWIKPRVVVL